VSKAVYITSRVMAVVAIAAATWAVVETDYDRAIYRAVLACFFMLQAVLERSDA
jgi:hypothetical protein